MLLLRSQIIKKNVYELKTQTRVGKIFELVFDCSSFKIIAFVLQKSLLSSKKIMLINSADIIQANKSAIFINNIDSISSLDENVRVKKAVNDKFYGIGQKVITKSGKTIGKMYDFVINSETLNIEKIYVSSFFGDRIIPIKNIISIEENRKIIIKDEYRSIKVSSQAVETSVI